MWVPDYQHVSELVDTYNASAYNADSCPYHLRKRRHHTKDILHDRPQLPFVTKLGGLILLLFEQVENSVKQVEFGWKSGFPVFLCGGPPNVFVLGRPRGQCRVLA